MSIFNSFLYVYQRVDLVKQDWFAREVFGSFKPQIFWFPVIVPLNQSIELEKMYHRKNHGRCTLW